MKVEEKFKIKSVFVALLAFFAIALWLLSYVLSAWLADRTTNDLYVLLHATLFFVILGVVVEEWKLFWKGCKFVLLVWVGHTREAFTKAWSHKGELVESAGFLILVVGLAGELALDPLIEKRQLSDQQNAAKEISELDREAKTAERRIEDAKINAELAASAARKALDDAKTIGEELSQARTDLKQNEQDIKDLLPRRFVSINSELKEINKFSHTPVFISSLPGEPAELAASIAGLFGGLFGNSDRSPVSLLPVSHQDTAEGVTIEYADPSWPPPIIPRPMQDDVQGVDPQAEKLALLLCHILKRNDLQVSLQRVSVGARAWDDEWPKQAPHSAVVIHVGTQHNVAEEKLEESMGRKKSDWEKSAERASSCGD